MKAIHDRAISGVRSLLRRAAEAVYLRRRKLLTSGVALLALWVAFHVVFGANGMVVYAHKRSEYKTLQSDLDAIKAENERLAREVQALKTDPRAIEREAREQLRYARPGEIIYTMPGRPAQSSTATARKHQP
jgi:cell division protein FtsB